VADGANNYVHPTGGANTTIAAANLKVLSAITVNSLGHVTSVSSKNLIADDIPNISTDKLTSGTLGVARGGTGTNTLTANNILVGNGTNAISAPYTVETTLSGGNSSIPRADAVKTYVDNLLAANDAMVFKGTIGSPQQNATINGLTIQAGDWPANFSAGWTYRVITAGTYAGEVSQVGDLIIAIKDYDDPQLYAQNVNSYWTVVQTNIDGAVTGTGTTNYISKWTSSSVQGNSQIFDNGTDVGIRTTSPESSLTINTTIGSSSNINSTAGYAFGIHHSGMRITSPEDTSTNPNYPLINLLVSRPGGYQGGTASIDFDSRDRGNSINRGIMARILGGNMYNTAANAAGGGYLSLEVAPTGSTTPISRIAIINNGNVGIGTSSPAGNLSVVGASAGQVGVHVHNTTTNGYSVIRLGIDSSAGSQINIHAFNSSWSGTGAFAPNAGNVSNTTGALTLAASNASGSIQFYTAGTGTANERMRITNTGDVGIGTNSPSYKLQVNGSFGATTKSFRIDHPSKPDYTLEYGSLESPYHGVRLTGRGRVVKGVCVVDLPPYLKDLIHDDENINIQLTNLKHGKTLYVSNIDLNNSQFTVKCDRAKTLGDLEFFWTFTGVRKDVPSLVVEKPKEV